MLKLIIGNKKFSSWSMRPYVLMRHFDIPFEEVLVPLDTKETDTNIRKYSPTGRVPVLIDGTLTIWDTLSICEYLAETFPQKSMWPKDKNARAVARSVCAEMHSSFQELRKHLPMKIVESPMPARVWPQEVTKDIERVQTIWSLARKQFGAAGPYLFGEFSIADAFFAPVAMGRFKSYSVAIDAESTKYVEALAQNTAIKKWLNEAQAETLTMSRYG